jgi:UDP-glucose 4-epimerase
MRALVTGCAGFIGSHLTEALLRRGDAVIGIDCFNDNYGRDQKLRNLRHFMHWDDFEFVPVDLTRGDLEELAAGCGTVFHLAAEPGVRASWRARYSQYVQNNILATQQLLDAVKERPEVRFVYASSSSVYGNATVRPTPEDAPTSPLSPYGQTKLSGEHLCSLYRDNFGVDAVALRYFTVYGPRQRPDMAFHIFCRATLEGKPVTVFGDGRQTRDFTYVEDVVAATTAAGSAEVGEDRLFNVGGGTPASIRDVLELIGDLADTAPDVKYLDTERGDVQDTAADTARARDVLGFAPQTTLRDGVAAELEWVRGLL